MIERFNQTGSIQRRKRKPVHGDLVREKICEALESGSNLSQARMEVSAAFDKQVSKSYAWKVARTRGLFSYKITTHQELPAGIPERRYNFARDMHRLLIEFKSVELRHIIFSDESIVHVGGHIHKQNDRKWKKKGGHYDDLEQDKINKPKGWHIFVAINQELGIIGPYFIDDIEVTRPNIPEGVIDKTPTNIVDRYKYQALIKNHVVPAIREKARDKGIPFDKFWFQQDGASAHTTESSIEILSGFFGSHVITSRGRKQSHREWPPRSPDMTPLDYWFWARLKRTLRMINRCENLARTRQAIETVCADLIPDAELVRAIEDFRTRLGCLIEHDGGRFQKYLKAYKTKQAKVKKCPHCEQEHDCYCKICLFNCRLDLPAEPDLDDFEDFDLERDEAPAVGMNIELSEEI